jgi:hypothetical protein
MFDGSRNRAHGSSIRRQYDFTVLWLTGCDTRVYQLHEIVVPNCTSESGANSRSFWQAQHCFRRSVNYVHLTI